MTHKNDQKTERVVPENRALVYSMVRSMADTTWRMFTPTVIAVPVGFWADMKLGTKPWLTLLGVPVGLGLSVLLVKKQLEQK